MSYSKRRVGLVLFCWFLLITTVVSVSVLASPEDNGKNRLTKVTETPVRLTEEIVSHVARQSWSVKELRDFYWEREGDYYDTDLDIPLKKKPG